jgi:prolyl oligopeptidase
MVHPAPAALVLAGTVALAAGTPATVRPPEARTQPHLESFHGVEVEDPYVWLEEVGSPETAGWAAAQNGFAERFAGAGTKAIEAGLLRLSTYWNAYRHFDAGGRTFFLRGWPGSPHPGLYVTDAAGTRWLAGPRVEPGVDPASAGESVRSFWPSPDGSRVLVLAAARGESFGRLRLLEVASGAVVAELPGEAHTGFTGATWLRDGSALVFSRYDREGERTAVRGRTVLLQLADLAERTLLGPLAAGEGRHRLQTPFAAGDSRRIFVEAADGTSGRVQVYRIDLDAPAAAPRPLFEREARWLFLGDRGADAWFFTDDGAPHGRVVRLAGAAPGAAPVEVVAERPAPIAAGSQVGGNAYGMFGDRIALLYQEEEGATIRAFDLAGRQVFEKRVPASGSLWGGFTPAAGASAFHYQFLGIADPSTVYRVDLETGRETLVSAATMPFGRDAFEARRVVVASRDGSRVPVLIAHRTGLTLDRPRRLVLYGYGAFGWNSFLWYQPWLAHWFEQDGVFAVAGVRGGGERGEAWHEAGRRRNRQNAIDDYLAASEWLIAQGWTDRSRLVANGGSIAGGLAGAALVQRPELYGAALLDYPVLDLLRYPEFGQARYWIDELGDPRMAGDFEVLARISPYHALRPGGCYPATLLRPGAHDAIVTPAHAFKFAARLQAAQGCARPVLLDVMEGAAHDYGTTPAEVARNHAVALAFLDRVLPR